MSCFARAGATNLEFPRTSGLADLHAFLIMERFREGRMVRVSQRLRGSAPIPSNKRWVVIVRSFG
jgi:hypothetical protein